MGKARRFISHKKQVFLVGFSLTFSQKKKKKKKKIRLNTSLKIKVNDKSM